MAGGAASASEVIEVNLEVVGLTELGGAGPFDDVAVVGTTAVVAGSCPRGEVSVVDIRDVRRPALAATLTVPPGTAAADLDALAVLTPAFTGDLMAVALAPCGDGRPGGVLYYDVSDPANPRLLAEGPGCAGCAAGTGSVSLGPREDGRILSLRMAGPAAVAVDDVTDPVHPAPLGQWSATGAASAGSCELGHLHDAVFHDDGRRALVVATDGRVYDLDLSDPARPSDAGAAIPADPASAGGSGSGAVMPVGTRTLAIVADQGADAACPGATGPGLRLLELDEGVPPLEVGPVRFTTDAPPGRLVASGELAYVAWHGDGLRVVDLGEVRARAVAQFVPVQADIVGVALLADHIVVTDRSSGLYVLERPEEAGGEHSFWTDLVGLLPYLGFAGILAAIFVVPRLAMGRAPAPSGAGSPVPSGVPRRRA